MRTKIINATEYKGFQIDDKNRIYRNGREIFKAHYQQCYSLQEAKDTIDHALKLKEEMTNYQQAQLNKHGNVLPEPFVEPDGTCENGVEELERFENWINEQAEYQLYQSENQ